MAKRLTGTDKWDKAWYRKLPPKYKCFWQYLMDKCHDTGGFYLGTTCPKCNRPFRSVKA